MRRYRKQQVGIKTHDGAETRASQRWLLESREIVVELPRGGRLDTVTTLTTYRYRAAHLHESRHRQREAALDRNTHANRPSPRTVSASGADPIASTVACADELLPPKGTNFSGQVVWQHGWMSDGQTWCLMRQAARATHQIGYDQAHTTDWKAHIDDQANDLANRMSHFSTPSVVVAHSQGGLIARSLGQSRPDLVRGIITIGTPHLGAFLASNAKSAIAERLTNAIVDGCNGTQMCELFGQFGYALSTELLTWGIDQTIPVANDDAYQSGLVQRLNASFESFQRASIQQSVPPRWAIFRLIGDAFFSARDTIGRLGGPNLANNAQIVYSASQMLIDLSLNTRYWTDDYGTGVQCSHRYYRDYWPPCYDAASYGSYFWVREVWDFVAGILELIGRVMVASMDRLDFTWADLTTSYYDGGATDGFIQYSSQVYPNVPGTFAPFRVLAGNRESHAGETASGDVLREVRTFLVLMGVPQK